MTRRFALPLLLLLAAAGACVLPWDTANNCEPTSELCNGVDDDCDGEIDEGYLIDAGCTVGLGQCAAPGRWLCTENGAGLFCEADAGAPVAELCNQLDDDCDGETDEGLPDCCVPGTAFYCGVTEGECTRGVQACLPDGTFGNCLSADGGPARLPDDLPERCNGLDDDCDGQTDDGIPTLGDPCDAPGGDLCKEGQVVCATDGGVRCEETAPDHLELCNALDDDCDGQTDEDFPTLGQACDGPGSDLCTEGTRVCNSDGGTPVCQETAPNRVEVCNGADDDCDGQTDESFLTEGQECLLTGPTCLVGVLTCGGAGGPTCTTPGTGAKDCCGNGIDDDSDGLTDEDTFTERCNGLDDDCDGQTDEPGTGLCPAAHEVSATSCTSGACAVSGCSAGFFDKNATFADGCESTVP